MEAWTTARRNAATGECATRGALYLSRFIKRAKDKKVAQGELLGKYESLQQVPMIQNLLGLARGGRPVTLQKTVLGEAWGNLGRPLVPPVP